MQLQLVQVQVQVLCQQHLPFHLEQGRKHIELNCVNFRRAREILAKKANESAQAGRPPGVDSKNPVKPEHLQLALSAGTIGRGNPKALVCFTHIACTVGFGLRP